MRLFAVRFAVLLVAFATSGCIWESGKGARAMRDGERRYNPATGHYDPYYSPAVSVGSDRNYDGTVGFTDLQNGSRPEVMNTPRNNDEASFKRHLDQQSPNWREDHRDELPR